MRVLTWVVTESEAGLTVEEFLREKGCSHHVLSQLKHTEDGILLNNILAYANQRLIPGDEILIRLEEESGSDTVDPVEHPLEIVYEDEDLLVVDKPRDMPVHPSLGNHDNTLANAVMYYCTTYENIFKFRCINRLDRDTSGLLLIAKNSLSSAILYDQAAKHEITRGYFAIVKGRLPRRGTIDQPIARKKGSALERCVDPVSGDPAVTHYMRIGCYQRKKEYEGTPLPEKVSLASVCLETGRTHQIRVHMASIGHPLPGDFLYNPASVCDLAPRQLLHACRLSFRHPITKETLVFDSALPEDMTDFLNYYEEIRID